MVFTFPTNVLISHLKAALRFVSTDEARPEISCLRIESHGAEARFVATDGFRLWVAAVDSTTEKAQLEDGAMHISRADAVRLASKLIDKKSSNITIRYERADHLITVQQGSHVATFRGVDLEKLEKEYPSFGQLFPAMVPAETPRIAFAVSGTYLMDAAASFADIREPALMKAVGSSIRVIAGDTTNAPVTVSSEGVRAVALIMPTVTESYESAIGFIAEQMARFSNPPVPSRKKRS